VSIRVWAPLGAVCVLAVGRAVTAAPPERAPDADDALLHRAFSAIASDEHTMRHEAAKSFPTDPWSRDDDFHRRELDKVRDWAGQHRVPRGAVFGAMDDGIRAHWPQTNGAPLVVTVPPCRPRAIY
jgi:hypothetical protein